MVHIDSVISFVSSNMHPMFGLSHSVLLNFSFPFLELLNENFPMLRNEMKIQNFIDVQ
jgi:hypothetical protein